MAPKDPRLRRLFRGSESEGLSACARWIREALQGVPCGGVGSAWGIVSLEKPHAGNGAGRGAQTDVTSKVSDTCPSGKKKIGLRADRLALRMRFRIDGDPIREVTTGRNGGDPYSSKRIGVPSMRPPRPSTTTCSPASRPSVACAKPPALTPTWMSLRLTSPACATQT